MILGCTVVFSTHPPPYSKQEIAKYLGATSWMQTQVHETQLFLSGFFQDWIDKDTCKKALLLAISKCGESETLKHVAGICTDLLDDNCSPAVNEYMIAAVVDVFEQVDTQPNTLHPHLLLAYVETLLQTKLFKPRHTTLLQDSVVSEWSKKNYPYLYYQRMCRIHYYLSQESYWVLMKDHPHLQTIASVGKAEGAFIFDSEPKSLDYLRMVLACNPDLFIPAKIKPRAATRAITAVGWVLHARFLFDSQSKALEAVPMLMQSWMAASRAYLGSAIDWKDFRVANEGSQLLLYTRNSLGERTPLSLVADLTGAILIDI